jgi:gluconate 2-dehydrogenase gamma chain
MSRSNLRRRRFLQLAATAAASGAASCGGRRNPYRFFSEEEAATVTAMCGQIIPADQDPGAAEAGVANFIDRQLTGHYKKFQQDYRKGLAGVEESSRILFQKRFAELNAGQQLELLSALEKTNAPGEIWKTFPPKPFFEMVIAHTMQGFYGDPRHGGNRDAVSWKMLGVPRIPVRGRNQYDLRAPGGSKG